MNADLNTTRTVATEMIELEKPSFTKLKLEGIHRYFPMSEITLHQITHHNNAKITKVEHLDDFLFGGSLFRASYKKDEPYVAYVISARMDIDAVGEEILMFKPAADPGRPGIEAVFQWAREACQELHDKEVARLLELDKLVPEGFRSVLLGEKSRQVALNIYRAEGELTQDVFAPYKNTLAWPKTEEETRNYFSRTLCRETVEAYLAVGELIAKDLL